MTEMRAVNRDLTFAGVIVVAPSEANESPTSEQKAVLDALHLSKNDLADRVWIVDPRGYVEESTWKRSPTRKRPASQSPSPILSDDEEARSPEAPGSLLRRRDLLHTAAYRPDGAAHLAARASRPRHASG